MATLEGIINSEETDNDICFETGRYNDRCDCSLCSHKYECSGSEYDEDEED